MNFGSLDLNAIWFILIGVLFMGYAMLDGFDLGVGALHLFTRSDEERRVMLNAIGPVWDGNEVWLVTGGGALFAAFPNVYATVFSGFYLAFVLLLVALIFRAVAIEFRSKQPMRWWRQMWDIGFSAGSILSSLLIGVAMGNIAWGIPIDDRGEFAGTFWSLLHPYPLLLGVTTVALFMMHGAIYALMKTEGAAARQTARLDQPMHHLLHHLLRGDDDGDAALRAAHGGAGAGQPVAVQHRAGQHAGHRQHPARDSPRPGLAGLSLLVRRDDHADGALRPGDVPEPGLQQS